MVDETQMRATVARMAAELRENILPFWLAHTVDRERGGFYGLITNDLRVDAKAPRGALLTSRILWTFAAAYRWESDPAYLEMANWAYEDLMSRFWDTKHGGFLWSAGADGAPLQTHKQVYGQAFAIYALAEYFAASGVEAALERAQTMFGLLETHTHDPVHGGYHEALSREWGPRDEMSLNPGEPSEPKSMNTSIHVMEALTNLVRVWPDPLVVARLAEMVSIMMDQIIDPETHHTVLFFAEDWAPRSENVSYGHDIETSWLLVEAAEAVTAVAAATATGEGLGEDAGPSIAGRSARRATTTTAEPGWSLAVPGNEGSLLERAKGIAVRMAQAVYEEGVDPDGAVLYESGPHGWEDDTKQWWPQAEGAVGFLNAYQLSGESHFLKAAYRCWDFIDTYLVNRRYGGWIRYVARDHASAPDDSTDDDDAKVSFWKCPYHNGRACLEMASRLRRMQSADGESRIRGS